MPAFRPIFHGVMDEDARSRSATDLRALARWEGEGGARAWWTLPKETSAETMTLADKEQHILHCLGAAVLLLWNELPVDIQRKIFETAASVSASDQTDRLREQLARFLHDHKGDDKTRP